MQKIFKIALVNLGVVLLLLFVIEGAASYVLTGVDVARSSAIPERRHTEYDDELGWVNLPDIYIADMYGPGVYLQTNRQRFRNARDFAREVPDGYTRVICSGDSFTLGFGVDNDNTWCSLLGSGAESLESVNMGQGGYGIDQAYLWYMRDGAGLDHQLHLFAFITEDFWRMGRDSFQGYGKPLVVVQDGDLHTRNQPVPRTSYAVPWITRSLPILSELSTVQLADGILHRLFGSDEEGTSVQSIQAVASTIFEKLQRTNHAKGSRLVLVYLPAPEDYMGAADTEDWRSFAAREAEKRSIPYVDVVAEMRKIPPEELKLMFGPHAHYSEAGNAFVADVLRRELAELTGLGLPDIP